MTFTGNFSMNTCDVLRSATLELAGCGSIKQRLAGAYAHHLASLDESEIPKEVREDFCALTRALTAVRPLPGEDPVRASVRKMSDYEANRYAAQIVNLFGTVARQQPGIRQSSQVVQLFAADA